MAPDDLVGVEAGDARERRRDNWVGPRPLTTDGMPLIGTTAIRGVYVAGGHGMWGRWYVLGPKGTEKR